MITRIRLMAALGVAFASAVSIGARADSCVDKATRLQSTVASLPSSDPNREELSDSLDMAMTTDSDRCEQIVADVQERLDGMTQGGHASPEKPVPNYPNAPADETGGPGFSDDETSSGGMNGEDEGHASGENPVPNQTEIPAASRGPSYDDEENEPEDSMDTDSDESSSMETAPEGHASEEDPIPNAPEVTDQGTDRGQTTQDSDEDDEDDQDID
jgi:hypothetical protein